MKARKPFQGVLAIARFNWPFCLAAFLVLVAASVGLVFLPGIYQLICAAAIAGSLYFLVGSLGISHLIYDRSDLYRWNWLNRALRGVELRRAIFCHSGFDETSADLQIRFPHAKWQIFDHFDEARMTEASIRRARALFPPTAATVRAPFDRWPAESEGADAIFGLLAIHELRSAPERTAWFAEACRCLRPGGRVILVEHARDLANFLAFGPGFLHFHSVATWRHNWEAASFRASDEFCVTPWVRVFVLSTV